jgi:hypothetical protein
MSLLIVVSLQKPMSRQHSAYGLDYDEQCDFADQGPLTDMDLEEDEQILATLLKDIPTCMNAADIQLLLQDIPVQPPVAVPVKTVQETVAAGDMPPLDVEAGNVILAPFPNNLNRVESFNVKTDFDLQGDGPGRPGVVCAPSTLFQLYLVPHRRQGVQRLSQGGIPGVFQHV